MSKQQKNRTDRQQPLLVFWQQCSECGHEVAAHGRVKCVECGCRMTKVAVAGSIVDSRCLQERDADE